MRTVAVFLAEVFLLAAMFVVIPLFIYVMRVAANIPVVP